MKRLVVVLVTIVSLVGFVGCFDDVTRDRGGPPAPQRDIPPIGH
jgi:hypothetical protein